MSENMFEQFTPPSGGLEKLRARIKAEEQAAQTENRALCAAIIVLVFALGAFQLKDLSFKQFQLPSTYEVAGAPTPRVDSENEDDSTPQIQFAHVMGTAKNVHLYILTQSDLTPGK